MRKSSVITNVLNFVDDDYFNNYYVGIATDVKQRLIAHQVNIGDKSAYRYYVADSEDEAREIEKYLLDRYDFQGGTGGGDAPRWVYVYRITKQTREDR
ncbi:hypothetical protein [uncultured Mailhella sp.]|uniref:hypothetical protein n=1 Tax=uncultured Mailhella sp. TaxID=1981031 RepID=UPI0025ED5BA7|nr:hypothetical protein [uncultured Mailhella sp.]